MIKRLLTILTLTTLCALNLPAADELERGFTHPPDSARPWVYWFWLNGNITREGHHRRPGGDEARRASAAC